MVESQYVHRHCVLKVASHFNVDSKIEGQQPAARGSRSKGSSQPPGAADQRAATSRQGQQIEGQQPATRGSRSKGSSQPPGAADRRAAASHQGQQIKGQQPATRGSRSRGSRQPPGAADRGAIPQTAVTQIVLALSLAPKRAFLLHDSKSIEVTLWLNIYRWAKH